VQLRAERHYSLQQLVLEDPLANFSTSFIFQYEPAEQESRIDASPLQSILQTMWHFSCVNVSSSLSPFTVKKERKKERSRKKQRGHWSACFFQKETCFMRGL